MRKYIYWRKDLISKEKGKTFANVHMLVGYNQGTIADFQEMASELRKTFPVALDSEIRVGKVVESRSVFGFSIITWSSSIPRGEYPGWEQIENGRCEYKW
ncbi:MAG: hypothetical protein KGJ89_02995 [Patescibacteria group bacterium]|nr:hypothetical protein [Patescibacteria group bacterium]MDE2015483.1 hypothetical protein [Patescibacteria group bacterium]MDE2226901.1 hypothetical protein [Patescibacteria group bacterium]